MSKTASERRLAENEVLFRQINERVQQGFEELKRIAKEDDQEHMLGNLDEAIQFYCECSDEDCRQRITMKPSVYTKIHKHRNHFVVINGHEIPDFERVIERTRTYSVVEKFKMPPESSEGLNETGVKTVE